MTAALPPEEAATTEAHAVLVAVTRLEAKVDVALAQHGARLEEHSRGISDHEERLRAVEARKTVSPAGLWTAVASAVAAFGVLAPYLSNLTQGAH